jgi:hypothetical protein
MMYASRVRGFAVRSACSCKPGRNGEPPHARRLCLDLPVYARRCTLRPLARLLSSRPSSTCHALAPSLLRPLSSYHCTLRPHALALPFCLPFLASVSFSATRPAPFSCSLVLCSLVDAPRPTPPMRTSVLTCPYPLRHKKSPVTKVPVTKLARKTRQPSISPDLYIFPAPALRSYPRPTPIAPEPACQATRSPLAETVKNAPVCRSPYDATFHPLQLATSSTTPLQAFEHTISRQKQPFSGKSSLKSFSTHNEFLYIKLSHAATCTIQVAAKTSVSQHSPRLPLSGLLLLESPLSRTPAVPDKPPFPTAFRRMRTTLTPKVNLSEQGRLGVSGLHYAGAALVDHVVLKGVKVETQADYTMLTQALAFGPIIPRPGVQLQPAHPALQACSPVSRSVPFRDISFRDISSLVRVIVLAITAHHGLSNTWCAIYRPNNSSYIHPSSDLKGIRPMNEPLTLSKVCLDLNHSMQKQCRNITGVAALLWLCLVCLCWCAALRGTASKPYHAIYMAIIVPCPFLNESEVY